jgi:hypothetical protein
MLEESWKKVARQMAIFRGFEGLGLPGLSCDNAVDIGVTWGKRK